MKQDLENSEYKDLLNKYNAIFSASDIPMKIIGKSLLNNTIYVRWKDGSYEFTSHTDLLNKYPELFI
ncbi:hypothetical protein EHI8A_104620 [Entamoeba histolytica HM-1:IMSS-B]|uniref:Uncharacterized protein n=9 Tax=Entamoeba TaxID=5758 RepID=C4MAL7_ENTH1|nr:hypothetical protein ENU1_213170 [Entamoeba nuttalli P19]XP_650169.1 hypothetical protein EHI_123270 [Entamoeba histolytica HM-1:IMSS]EMD45500.1 Hypothetical protein EHI5A_138880 [Entamoeba histolytica KU27]EMH73123.1 hypothetical protein EHI8A_104620 [Entamoeba histolytica HM-1:IMSS-B]EMS14233.1 hypothetical protein KM1_175400 [Entamoeba histolytica HM-3:IMSS]ENY61020.1 hypothetical protein EHI7A_097730 [Entamoeba histolytica HM-1:IMSS-A]EAL44782.1 hypothetical protein EHI_123270 [Entamoe|eukprot:XP_008860683.1 hypothetical protein ENU1_213170 [Entamoeba nuttalli P19]